ncbi:MAG: IS30 family transposase, partial [Clostridium sp.]|nr:IS30 family transposase [Clostridium sp.]
SLNNRTQEEITLMMNHINNTARASLNGNTLFKLAQMLLDNSLLDKLLLKYIPADEIHLKPALFKK